MNQPEAFRLAAILFVVGAAMIVYVSYPTYIAPAVFIIGMIVLSMGVYLFLAHVKSVPVPSSS